MSKDPKRLQPILRVRRIEEERSAGALAHANASLAQSVHGVQLEHERHRGRPLPSGSADGTRTAFVHLLGTLSAEGCQRARQQEAAAADDRAAAQHEWTEAARRVAALERLEDRWRELRAAEAVRAEQAVLDELAGRRRRSA